MNLTAYVITIPGHELSERAAARCIESGERFGVTVKPFAACTPADNPRARFLALGWPVGKFETNPYSRPLPCMSCFLSHALLWGMCAKEREPIIILEHDAIFVRELPNLANEHGLVSLGRPSFGKWRQPPTGIGALVSKPHLPGAHGYYLHPVAAVDLLAAAKHAAEPTDVFLSLRRFRFIREAFPWPVECREAFTTIQGPKGCTAKHRPVDIV